MGGDQRTVSVDVAHLRETAEGFLHVVTHERVAHFKERAVTLRERRIGVIFGVARNVGGERFLPTF